MNTTPTPVTLHNDQTVIADLDRFLAGAWRGPATTCYLIDALGEFSVLLGRHAHDGQQRQDQQ